MQLQKLASALLGLSTIVWAADPAVGTWKLDPAKSKYMPGPPAKSGTVTYEETAGGFRRTGTTVDANGKATSFEYTAKLDGADYPVKGSETFDAIAIKRLNDNAANATLKKGGKVVSTAQRVVSQDGKTLTITISGTDPQGRKMKNVSVYQKQ
jgi:hypothetical protein